VEEEEDHQWDLQWEDHQWEVDLHVQEQNQPLLLLDLIIIREDVPVRLMEWKKIIIDLQHRVLRNHQLHHL